MSELKITYDSKGKEYIVFKHASYSCDNNNNNIAYNRNCFFS